MPGILPMKVIKIGSAAQQRIAQACDRCRSKKIRCDGMRPSCTQCVNVGFECKTSDKLSRRAFPRGYTESLEDRVRSLETEVRDLKILLDEKDEKIDMLSRIHSHSHSPHIKPIQIRSSSTPSAAGQNTDEERAVEKEGTFKVNQSPVLVEDEHCESYFSGTSNSRTLIDAFKMKLQSSGKFCVDIHSKTFFPGTSNPSTISAEAMDPPPRLVSDQLVNIFFQEWAPLFPILHRPTFLSVYERFVAGSEEDLDEKSIAQLYLVFAIAALASENDLDLSSFEKQWQDSLESFIMDNDMATLQCLSLAQIYCLQTSDQSRLFKYKGLSVSLAQRLGLHQSQKRFALGALSSETRKKVFWTIYTLDCIAAAQLGLPRALNDVDVFCEYPVDADDEYITEKGFLPTLPGEYTKLSSALALFRLSRVLAKILAEVYPATTSYEISLKTIARLSDELEAWLSDLAPHLRLQFVQDKPSTHMISSRSPILSLAYNYMRFLLFRPVACSHATLGGRTSSALVSLGSASKRMIQIIQLLEERNLSFSFCLNKSDVLVSCAFGLLFQAVDLDPEGMLLRDSHRLILSSIEILEHQTIPLAIELRRILYTTFGSRLSQPPPAPNQQIPIRSDSGSKSQEALLATQRHLKAISARFCSPNSSNSEDDAFNPTEFRRAIAPTSSDRPSSSYHRNMSQTSLSSTTSDLKQSPVYQSSSTIIQPCKSPDSQGTPNSHLNLDYMAFTSPPGLSTSIAYSPNTSTSETDVSPDEWERIISTMDNGAITIYDTIYGGPGIGPGIDPGHFDSNDQPPVPVSPAKKQRPGVPAHTFARPRLPIATTSTPSVPTPHLTSRDSHGTAPEALDWSMMLPVAPLPSKSVLSLSDESTSSGVDEWGILMPELNDEGFVFGDGGLNVSDFHVSGNGRV